METIFRYSRYLLTILFCLVIIFSLSCSEDPSSPKKEDEDPIPQDVVTIGIEGGTVEKDDLTIAIPAGAFDGDYEISVSEIEDDGAFGENTVSASFKIKGLPSEYNKPIKIKAKYKDELSGESYLGVGRKSYDVISEDFSIVYELFSASDSAEYIISTIPANSSQFSLSKKSVEDESDIFVNFLTSYSSTETENFTFYFPDNTIPQSIAKLGVIFERAFTINNEGLQMPLVDEERIVNIVESKSESPLTYSRKSKVTNYNIPLDALNNEQYDKLQVAAQIYLFFRSCDYDLHWMTSSISYWLKDLVSDSPDYLYPAETFLENAMEPFNGFGLINGKNPKDHALGISGIIKYLTNLETFGLQGIGNLYINNAAEDKATLFLNNSGSLISEWWPDFFEKYINGEIYELPITYFLENTQHEWNIESNDDNIKIFESSNFLIKNYQDLSAKLFKINLNYQNIDASQNMLFSMKGPVTEFGLSLVIFGIQNENAVHLGTVHAQDFEIANLKDYYDNDMKQFLVALVNSNITSDDYLGESDIDLTVKVTPKSTISDFDITSTKCIATIAINAELQVESDGSTKSKTELLIFSSEYTIGSFEGKTYTGTYYKPDAGSGYFSGEIVVTLNETLDTIKTATFTGLDENANWGIRWEKGFTATNIPISPYENNVFTFSYDNTNICNSIKSINYFYKTNSLTKIYLDHTCDELSNVSFRFSKE